MDLSPSFGALPGFNGDVFRNGTSFPSPFHLLNESITAFSLNTSEEMGMPSTHAPGGVQGKLPAAPLEALVCLSLLFCLVGTVGLLGNALVIAVIVGDKKMRRSVTNLFIMNLALADFLIMLFGVPEILLFMMNRGWLLGIAMCRFQRYVLVFSLYASIMTLVGVCVERYIAIVHPIKAHIVCSRSRILLAIGLIWPMSLLFGLPTVLYNVVKRPNPTFPVELCLMEFPTSSRGAYIGYKLAESATFFLFPVLIQIVLYVIVGRRLFVGTERLHRKTVREENGLSKERDSDAIRARKGVVKMLIASVVVYFLSYAPTQVPLMYDLISPTPFKQNWPFLVLVMTLGYVNSAANPILYSIFSQNFRRKFRRALCCCAAPAGNEYRYRRTTSGCQDSMYTTSQTRSVRFSLSRANTTEVSMSEM